MCQAREMQMREELTSLSPPLPRIDLFAWPYWPARPRWVCPENAEHLEDGTQETAFWKGIYRY
jgi:hypothetical protein